jgi:pimeloyl-ACP methyl ester carboxylesterase
LNLARPDGSAIYWTSQGEGPPLVLSHGLLGDHRLFDPIAAELGSAGWRVIRWDLRGHGRSTRAVGPIGWADLAADLPAVLDAAGVERAVLVGHDMGAVISAGVALDTPERVIALSAWSFDAAPTPVAQRIQAALVTAARQVSIRPFTLALEPLWVNRRAEGHDAALAHLQRRVATTLSGGALADVIEATRGRPDLRIRLRELRMPMQVLWGERDRLLRVNAGREVLAGVPHAEGGAVPEAAHFLWVDRPAVLVAALKAFLHRFPEPS